MSSTYSNSLRVELIGSGDQAGAWGTTTNNNFAYIFDSAIAGYLSVDITASPHTLTSVSGPTSSSNLNQSVYAALRLFNAVGASIVYAPAVSKTYIIWNDTSYAVTLYNTGYSTGPTIAAGARVLVFSTGTAFYEVSAQTVNGVVPIAKGGTGQITANAAFNALAPAQTSANGQYLKSNGTDTSWDQINISTGDITGTLPIANGGTGTTSTTFVSLTTNVTGTLPVVNGGTGVTSSTGSGSNVLSTSPSLTSPSLTTPILGTPQSGNLSNCTFPTLNQNTTGTAAGLSSTLAIASGGTGTTGFTAGYIHYGSFSTSSGLTYNGTDFTCGGNVTAYSDERLKTNWRDLPADFIGQLAKVKHGIYDRTDQEMTQVGVSAQSLQPVMPNAVIEDDGKMSVAYGNAALVAAIKLSERVIALEARLEALTKG